MSVHIEAVTARRVLRPADVALLVGLVILSSAGWLWGLGFFSDDWSFLSLLLVESDGSFADMVRVQWESGPNLRSRPTQILLQALLVRTFGTQPLGYHLVNLAIMAALSVGVAAVARRLGAGRPAAIAVGALALALPQYATNRFWFAAFGFGLSLLALLIAAVLMLDAVQRTGPRALAGIAGAVAATAVAGLGYELVMPFIAVLPLVVGVRMRQDGEPLGLLFRAGAAAVWAVLLAVVAFKFSTSYGVAPPTVYSLGRFAVGSVVINLVTYGVALPVHAAMLVPRAPVIGSVLAVAGAVLLARHLRQAGEEAGGDPVRLPTRSLLLVAAGTYGLGYALAIVSARIDFTSSGIGNRTSMAATAGIAVAWVALSAVVARRLPGQVGRSFAVAVAVVWLAGSLIVNGLAASFTAVTAERTRVVDIVNDALPAMTPGSLVLVHNSCPYDGLAPILEAYWDVTGLLRLQRGTADVAGDVTTSAVVAAAAVQTSIYGVPTTYPFGTDLLLVDVRTGSVAVLDSRAAAIQAFGGEVADYPADCPFGEEGNGVRVFATDDLYHRLGERVRGS
ncbi:hypothetical protein BH23ACT9_BH23ACT9_10850 [soil metagenome]